MRLYVTHLGVALAAAVLGYAVGMARGPLPATREVIVDDAGRSATPLPSKAPADDAVLRDECRALAKDNDALREQLRRTRPTTGPRDDGGEVPAPAPDPFGEAPPEYRASAFSEHIRGVFADLGISGELDIDCSEFPCLAALRDHKMTKAEEDAVLAKLRARGYGDEAKAMLRRHSSVGPGGKAYLNVVAFYPGDREGDLEEILASRVEEQPSITRASVATPPE